ncbi:ATP-binding protein [Myceligenerans pegani]|uniref:AAA family ATPase n=1 Tax=Myceligenerans pegani TaxID=2776917 RepID=A0ABR9N0X8_9MICO|nr:LuxR family transcriptional regulator [Myceligenerans sp. TRM 65318]MBE1876667.1 AAA family ATPase [Myceligenerans sp. TRM 65318]MBE3018938.1 AAA family ATPase [Myceligenerans sp. TRM 65318]
MPPFPPADHGVPPTVSTPEFVGRDRDMEALRDAASRHPAIVLIEGEAGIGKSRLLQEWLATDGPRRGPALLSVCPPLRESLTLGPIVDAFRGVTMPFADLELTGLAGVLRPLFPEWSADLPPTPEPLGDARASRHRLFRALDELIHALDVSLLVLEDAHWADDVTLEFLLFLTSRLPSGGPSVVISYRPDEVDAGSLLLRLTSRLPAGVTQARIAPAPLSREDTATLVSSMLGGSAVSTEFTEFLQERTDGLPVALEESVRLMWDRADITVRDGQWSRRELSELLIPPTVRDCTRERVGRLSPTARQVLRAVATLAEPSSDATIAATADLAPSECRAGIAEAAGAAVLHDDGRDLWRFRHRLAAEAVYEEIARTERADLHLRAGRALESVRPLPAARLAHHFRAAGETELWTRYSERAAEHAMASGDHTTAVVLLEDLLSAADLAPPDLARVARTAGVFALSRREPLDDVYHRLIATLRAVLDSPELSARQKAEIRNPLGRLLIIAGEAKAALAELEQAVANLDHDPTEAARAMTYLGWAYAGPWPARTHARWLQRAAVITAAITSPADRLNLAGNRAAALLMLGEEEAWQVIGGLPLDGATSSERLDLARIHTNIGTGALIWGRHADAERHLIVATGLADTEQAARLRYNAEIEQANLAWHTGRWKGLAERGTALAATDRDRPTIYLATVRLAARLAAAAGRDRAAEEQFHLVLEEASRLGAVDDTMEPAAALARLRLAVGDAGQALRTTDRPMETLRAKGVWVWGTDLVPVRVAAYLSAGRPDDARRLTAQFERGLRNRSAPGPRAALAVCRAHLVAAAGEHTRAADAYARAARAWSALPRPYDAMLARERQAGELLAAGRADAGRELLAGQYESLFRLGARGDADRVAQRLRELGAEVPRLWRGGRKGYGDQLSPRELDVVRLVATGKTNREISRILAKSPATVDQQLRAAMRKLKVTSRTALAVTAVETGVLPAERTGARPT